MKDKIGKCDSYHNDPFRFHGILRHDVSIQVRTFQGYRGNGDMAFMKYNVKKPEA